MSMPAVVLAAGQGTRMRPLTDRRPKPLVPVAGRPIIEHIVAGLAGAGFEQIALVVGYKEEMMRAVLGDGRRLGAQLHYITQAQAAGTGAATLLAADFVGASPFFLGWGDIIVPRRSYRAMRELWEREAPEAILAVNRVEDPCEGAAVYVSEDGYVERIVEKPAPGTSTTNFNNAGLFIFPPRLLELLRHTAPSARGEIEVPSAIQSMLDVGIKIRAYVIDGYWSDVARPATALRISGEMIAAASRRGIIVHPEAHISGAAELVGPLYVGAGVEVAAARLGPNVCLMPGCRVGPGSRLSNALLLAGAAVGRECVLDQVVVEEGVTLADGTCLQGTAEQAVVAEG